MLGHRDPRCRFARWSTDHQCVDAFGWPLRTGQECNVEARQQIAEAAR